MVSRSYEGNDYRRGSPNYRGEINQSGRSGRDEGDYSYPPAIYGRENSRQEDRYPQRADYGYRDSEQAGRGSDAYRGDQGQGHYGDVDARERSGRDSSRQFDPDYHQWRDEQLSALDDDYQAWRGERYKKFADEFSQWRSGRSRPGEEAQGKSGEKENPLKNK